jgi:mono/diheme cytochrome c family protein
METGRPIEIPEARYDVTGQGKIVAPGPGGAHSWHPWSYNPNTGLVYIPAMDSSFGYIAQENFEISPRGTNVAVDFAAGRELAGQEGQMEPINEGLLLAWDPVTGKEVWRVSHGRSRGGGTLSTAGGLVFQGNSANKEFAAYDATTGAKLWSMPVNTGIVAGAASFEVDGEQMLAVLAGNNTAGDYYASNESRLLVFKLGGTATLPEPAAFTRRPLAPPEATAAPELVARGSELYSQNCNLCHGDDGLSRGTFPDLTRTPLLHAQEGFDAVVLGGALRERGMASFDLALDPPDTEALRAYLVARAHVLLAEEQANAAQAQAQPQVAPPIADNEPAEDEAEEARN